MSWQWKKRNSIALINAEAKYISIDMRCAQILWVQHTVEDYELPLYKTPLYCDVLVQ